MTRRLQQQQRPALTGTPTHTLPSNMLAPNVLNNSTIDDLADLGLVALVPDGK